MLRQFGAAAFLAFAAPAWADDLPLGIYEPYFTDWNGSLAYWLAGDIAIEGGNRYVFQGETGRYEITGQRIAFTGAGLDGAYAVIRESSGQKVIVIPHKENEDIGKEFAIGDIWAYRKK